MVVNRPWTLEQMTAFLRRAGVCPDCGGRNVTAGACVDCAVREDVANNWPRIRAAVAPEVTS